MMNKTHLVAKGTPKFDGADQLHLQIGKAWTIRLKGQVNQNSKFETSYGNSATLEDPGLQLVATNSATLGPDPRVTTDYN